LDEIHTFVGQRRDSQTADGEKKKPSGSIEPPPLTGLHTCNRQTRCIVGWAVVETRTLYDHATTTRCTGQLVLQALGAVGFALVELDEYNQHFVLHLLHKAARVAQRRTEN
jgi:hypothetical protein